MVARVHSVNMTYNHVNYAALHEHDTLERPSVTKTTHCTRCSMMHTHYNVMMSVQEASRGLGRRDNPAFSNILLAHFPRFFHHMWSLKPPLNSSQLQCLGAFCHVDVSICCFRPDWRLLKQLMDVSGRPPPRDYVYIFPNSVSQFVLW